MSFGIILAKINCFQSLLNADVHGFRTSFKTWAQEQTDFENKVSEMALAHTISNKAEAAYARSNYLEKRKKMVEDWSLYLGN